MHKDFKAFTVYGNELLPVLITEVNVRQAESLCNYFQLKSTSSLCKAIWDTGATNTAISRKLAEKLNLKIISTAECDGVNSTILTNIYKIDLLLPNRLAVLDIDVSEVDNIIDADILIGMDVILLGDFSITNANNKICFSFRYPPAPTPIDYVKDRKKELEKNKWPEGYFDLFGSIAVENLGTENWI